MTTLAMSLGEWSEQGPSYRLDVMCLVLAIALHVPLYFMKFDAKKKDLESVKDRLVAVDLVDKDVLDKPAPPPPVAVAPKNDLMSRLKMLVKREPPPPPPPPKAEKAADKLATGPKEIELKANLKMPEKVQPALASKSGFKTTADAKLVEDKQMALKDMSAGIAPLSEKKLGLATDKANLKSDKGNFKLAKGESISAIGGSGPSLSDPSAPAIAINTGGRGSAEKFSAPQKSDKGRLGNVSGGSLDSGQKLGLRDSMIARDAAPGAIAIGNSSNRGGVTGGVEGGVNGGVVGSKKDAGRYVGQADGTLGGNGTNPGGQLNSAGLSRAAVTAPKAAAKKSMFQISGPLKDRKIEHQVLPEYPAWAQAQGIEAGVILEFTVEPDGSVKDSIVVRRTTGYPQLDQAAMKALRKWKFAPIDENREEVGTITFNFSLN